MYIVTVALANERLKPVDPQYLLETKHATFRNKLLEIF
jgi:hypothetical protein